MIDTNSINQAGEAVQAVHAQLQMNWPAISAGAVIVARELANFNRWLAGVGESVIRHGGIFMIVKKLIWNPEVKP